MTPSIFPLDNNKKPRIARPARSPGGVEDAAEEDLEGVAGDVVAAVLERDGAVGDDRSEARDVRRGHGAERVLDVARVGPRAPAVEEEAPEVLAARALAARNRCWWDAVRDALDHWLSFAGICLAQLVATAVERVALTGQVQQLMSLPGQLPLEQLLRQILAVLGVKAAHLAAECARGLLSTRLGAKLDAKGRKRWRDAVARAAEDDAATAELRDPKRGLEMSCASRMLVVEAAPKALVEGLFGVAGACGALYASPFLAAYFVGHEACMAQLVGAAAGLLMARRDSRARRENDVREAWCAEFAEAGGGEIGAERELRLVQVEGGDAQLLLERSVDCAQLAVLSSYVVTSSALIEKSVFGVDGEKYQKVMGFAGGAMQAAQEVGACAERLGRGTELMAMLHALEDAEPKAAGAVDVFARFTK